MRMLWLHRLMSPHLVQLCINLVWYSKSLYSTSVTLLQESIWWKESLILCGSFIFFQLHLFVLSARKCFVLRTNQGNLVNFLWISFLQMNQYVWFASEYIFASLHKGVYFVSVRCFLCTVQMDFIESKSERSDETKIPGKYCKNYSISFRLKKTCYLADQWCDKN